MFSAMTFCVCATAPSDRADIPLAGTFPAVSWVLGCVSQSVG